MFLIKVNQFVKSDNSSNLSTKNTKPKREKITGTDSKQKWNYKLFSKIITQIYHFDKKKTSLIQENCQIKQR